MRMSEPLNCCELDKRAMAAERMIGGPAERLYD
jgi:hypothetical protein